jgi:predicted nucleic-acid-binding protein
MLSVDTNLIVRLLVYDDLEQKRIAAQVFESSEVWLSKTVLLEAEWVLRSSYGFSAADVCCALRKLVSHPNARLEDSAAALDALSLAESGFDFADALHVASCPPGAAFLSFDRNLVARAKRAGLDARLPR